MSFAAGAEEAPGEAKSPSVRPSGKLTGAQASQLDGVELRALRTVMQATNGGLAGLPMPKAAESYFMLFAASPLFPSLWRQGRGSKTASKDRS